VKFLIVLFMLFNLSFADDDHYYSRDLSSLHLSKKQEKQVKKILKNYRKEIKSFKNKKEDITEKKQKLFLSDKFDGRNLKRLNEILNKLKTNIENDFLIQMHEVLSKKQKRKFTYYIEEWEIE